MTFINKTPVEVLNDFGESVNANSSLTLTYDGSGNLITIQKTIGSTTYTKTLSYTGSDLTGVSAWS